MLEEGARVEVGFRWQMLQDRGPGGAQAARTVLRLPAGAGGRRVRRWEQGFWRRHRSDRYWKGLPRVLTGHEGPVHGQEGRPAGGRV